MAGRSSDISAASNGTTVTKSDVTILPTTRALYIGGAGDVVVTMAGGATLTFSAVPVGTILPIQVTQVKDATTATLVLALY